MARDDTLRVWIITWLLTFQLTCCADRMNVLFLVADDMRPQLGAYYGPDFPSPIHPKMVSPNLDRLASRSLLLKRAYTQQAVCSPSRTSLLTSRRPDTTHVYDLHTYWRKSGGNFTTIPQYFKENGYHTIGMGKIFHPGMSASGEDDPISWSEAYYHAPNPYYGYQHSWMAVNQSMRSRHGKLQDERLADFAIETLEKLAADSLTNDKPYFVAVGFHKPHLPFIIPEEFLDLYPESSISLPDNPYAPVNMPDIAWSWYGELRKYADIHKLNATGAINSTLPKDVTMALRRAYYSATSFTDSQIGRVLDTLDRLGLSKKTIVSFWGDHGWQLGEHGEWCKHTNFELATHAPLMIHVPGLTDHGIQTEALTEFADLFPTLVDVAGLPKLPLCPEDSSNIKLCTEGSSLLPLMQSTNIAWKPRVFSQYPRDGAHIMGYTVRTDRYRYTEWVKFTGPPHYKPIWSKVFGVELYDHQSDPEENVNQAYNPDLKDLIEELSRDLHTGWRGALPNHHRDFKYEERKPQMVLDFL